MKHFIYLIFLAIFLLAPQVVFAQSSYVLPYPSAMPGNKFYKFHEILEFVSKYWYFGNFGQFTYNLNESDKYLVEAKTLFEYKQYLLGTKSLEKSNSYFVNTWPYLIKAKTENKDISKKQAILREDSLKQIEELMKLSKEVPETFTWSPEKSKPTDLFLKKSIDKSIKIREQYL